MQFDDFLRDTKRACVAIDVSGGMDPITLRQFQTLLVSELDATPVILDVYAFSLELIYFGQFVGTKTGNTGMVARLKGAQPLPQLMDINPRPSMGTDFRLVKDLSDDVELEKLIIFTDGYLYGDTSSINKDVMWVIDGTETEVPSDAIYWRILAYHRDSSAFIFR